MRRLLKDTIDAGDEAGQGGGPDQLSPDAPQLTDPRHRFSRHSKGARARAKRNHPRKRAQHLKLHPCTQDGKPTSSVVWRIGIGCTRCRQ